MLNLLWKQGGNLIRGFATDWVNGDLVHPISFPSQTTQAVEVTLESSARYDQTFETLTNLKFYLAGDPDQLNLMLNVWPYYGQGYSPARDEMNGGIEVSFDGGVTFHRFGWCPLCQCRHGDPADPTTWLLLPATAISPQPDTDGVLGAFAAADMYFRYRIPPQATQYGIFDVRVETSFDVI